MIAVTTRFLGDDDAHLLVDHCLSKLGMVNNCLDIIGYTIGVLHVFLYSDIVFRYIYIYICIVHIYVLIYMYISAYITAKDFLCDQLSREKKYCLGFWGIILTNQLCGDSHKPL